MSRVEKNWERLVRATLRQEQLRSGGRGAAGRAGLTSGLIESVPSSLGRGTNIDAILHAADEIQGEDPTVARILCEYAYTLAQSLDPQSDGRGVLQFKTGLMSVIKQKLAKRGGGQIDRSQDLSRLWEFYEGYRARHRVDEIQQEEKKWRESGAFSGPVKEVERRFAKMKRVYATLKVLADAIEHLTREVAPEEAGVFIPDELKKVMQLDKAMTEEISTYNIVPLDAQSITNAIGLIAEVKAAISALTLPRDFPQLLDNAPKPQNRTFDIFDLLQYTFGFQRDNVRNQREHVILLIANAQSRLGVPEGQEPNIDEAAVRDVFKKTLGNYISWCKYLCKRTAWERRLEPLNREKKLLLIALYFLIWGEAANVRFVPECLCYIFHNMVLELAEDMSKEQVAQRAKSCAVENDASFLEKVIVPLYDVIAHEAKNNDNGRAPHSAWRNYDDFNEYFWSPGCFELHWPWDLNAKFFSKPRKRKGICHQHAGKISFVEHRTFLHLYHSFHRLWIFLLMMFQALTILGFNDSGINKSTVKDLLSLGPTYVIMNFVECFLDIMMLFGAYRGTRGLAITRVALRFVLFGAISVVISYLYVHIRQEQGDLNLDSFYVRIYLLILGAYTAACLVFSLLLRIPSIRYVSEKCDRWFCIQMFKWMFEEHYFVGRGLYERTSDFFRYVLYWLVVLACKFCFTYFLQIKPLVKPTREIVKIRGLRYSWHDLVSKDNHNALTIASFWAPVFAIYLLDLYVWHTILSAIVGGLIGARARLGEIRSIEMVHKRFESFPEAFVNNLQAEKFNRIQANSASSQMRDPHKVYAAKFSPFWNEIIKSLREEDYITNREMELLLIPLNTGNLNLVQWPLFLLSSKVFLAMDLALEWTDTQKDLWERISRDEYMGYAVQECYYNLERILTSLLENEGKIWVERLFKDINESIMDGSLLAFFEMKKLHLLVSRVTALTGLLMRDRTPALENGAVNAMQDLYEVVTHDILSSQMKERYETSGITRARLQGRLFSRIRWPRDAEMREQVKRLHLLLTIKDSAANIPKNLEARRRLEFFTNSLFMKMAPARPVREMIPFSVFTPYYSETVMYSMSELRKENEDGISILFYLQKIFPDEWSNFLERIGRDESTIDADLQDNSSDLLELRLWASYRGQTLARTVRGMMYYRKALMLQSYMERQFYGDIEDGYSADGMSNAAGYEISREAKAFADMKFTYVVTCQIYGQQKQQNKAEAADISLLMQRNEALRVAYIDSVDPKKDGKGHKEFYSKLIKADAEGNDQEIFTIKLPGDPKLGEGKPENQNHAIIFTRGEAIQTIDMNQDNYFEEALKMRNLLEEFKADHGLRAPTILGIREHVFTGSVSSLAWFMSNQETSFVTIGQRVLANPLKVRMHYGHPDVFDRVFHITRGGISKASRVINISEDIYAGFNSTLRKGNITHHEYIQVGKGRDVGLNQIALFEGKVAGGNGEQVLSRDVYRLGQLFDFFRMLSFYFTTVGFYVCTMLTVLTVYMFLYGKVYLALSGIDRAIAHVADTSSNTSLESVLNTQFLIQIGVFTAVPMVMGFVLEQGILKAIVSFVTMQLQLCSIFFTFSLGTRTHYFGRTILHGGAKYRATGRGFVVRHIKFAENYRLYSHSHFVKGFEVVLLLTVYIAYGYVRGGSTAFILITVSSWFLAISWLFAPYIFNPSGFEWQKTVEDFDDWTNWLLYKGGVGVKAEESWETWWDEEQSHIRTLRGKILETILSLRFFIFQYGIVYKLDASGSYTNLTVYGVSWLVLIGFILIFKVFTISRKVSVNFQLMVRFIQGATFITVIAALVLVVAFTTLTVTDLFASVLAFLPTGWAVLSLAITWKSIVRRLGLWKSVSAIARLYDAGMGMLLFAPIAILSWFPFVSTFQTRLLFNQAFSRGLEISLILAGNRPNVEA
eukprot:TRINITY_DN18640_c0_g1_i2.p1 TRINITY_DN18640_c0_g1~~TRINITY_DN18640_c0_g1_i2.p1  ORF type:complete len:1915 (+),score=322.94 TRINITY_DN18640_c0_g1_i2:50-5794(+)